MLQDIRFALRYWRKHPAFAGTAIGLLALAIAANAILFSAADALLLKPLPVKDPDRLVRVVEFRPKLPPQTWYPPPFEDFLRSKTSTLGDVFGGIETDAAMTGAGESRTVRAMVVSGNYFHALAVPARLGRFLEDRDDASGELPVVLSHGMWRRQFQGDTGIIGRNVKLGGAPFRIVGVMPDGFHGVHVETSPEVWVSRSGGMHIAAGYGENGRCCMMELAARTKAGVSFETASQEVRALWLAYVESGSFDREDREFYMRQALQVQPIRNGVSVLRDRFGFALQILLAASAALLLIACANVAGLLLSSAAARKRETAIRMAIGATGSRLARQWATEALLLTVSAALAGICITYAVLPLLPGFLPPLRNLQTSLLHIEIDFPVDPRLLGYAVAASLFCTLLISLSPILQVISGRVMERGSTASGANPLRMRKVLVGFQVALCTALLFSASLLVHSVDRLAATPTGMDAANITGFTLKPVLQKYTKEQVASLAERLAAGARELPGTVQAAVAVRGLMRGSGLKATAAAEGTTPTQADFLNSSMNSVTPEYFETMGIPVLAGRLFRRDDDPNARVVTRAFAERFFPGQDAVGRKFGIGALRRMVSANLFVLGVVEDVKYRGLREPIHPQIFSCLCAADAYVADSEFQIQVRTREGSVDVSSAMTALLRRLDPLLPFAEIHVLREEAEATIWQERVVARLSAGFGVAAALLAGFGLYGMLSFLLAQQMREAGIRKALGAQTLDLARWLGHWLLPVCVIGVGSGSAAVWVWIGPWLKEVLWETSPRDPLLMLPAFAAVLATMAIAVWRPLRRAAAVDPARVLRESD